MHQIANFLQISNQNEAIGVLKAIEAQHGLLIERADELWSFSHLTFQEYFTVQWLTQLPPKQLAEKIVNQQWQRVVEQIVKSQQPADYLLRLIKQAIDQFVTQDPIIQNFLEWLLKKSGSLQTNYRPVAIRAFYYALACNYHQAFFLALEQSFDSSSVLNSSLDLDLALEEALDFALDLDLALDLDINIDVDLDRTLDRSLNQALAIALIITLTVTLEFNLYFDSDYPLYNINLVQDNTATLNRVLDHTLNQALNISQSLKLSPNLTVTLNQLNGT